MDHRPNLQKIQTSLPKVFDEKLISIEKVSDGLVHYVYKVTTKKRTFFAKIRGRRTSRPYSSPTQEPVPQGSSRRVSIRPDGI